MESLTKGKLIMVFVICKEILANHKIVLTVAWCHVASLNGSADFSFLLTLQSLLEEMSCYWCFIMINAVELLNFIYAPSAPQLLWALLMFSLWTVGIIRRNEINLSADWGDWSSFKFCYLDGGFLGCRMCYVVVFHKPTASLLISIIVWCWHYVVWRILACLVYASNSWWPSLFLLEHVKYIFV